MDGLPDLDREELELRAYRAREVARTLAELAETDGWKLLTEIFVGMREHYFAGVTKQLMGGREINQRKLDFNRGLFEGVEQLLKHPEKAEDQLRKALTRLADHVNDSEE